MECSYNLLYDNSTGRVVLIKNNKHYIKNKEFDEIDNYIQSDSFKNNNIDKLNFKEDNLFKNKDIDKLNFKEDNLFKNKDINNLNFKEDNLFKNKDIDNLNFKEDNLFKNKDIDKNIKEIQNKIKLKNENMNSNNNNIYDEINLNLDKINTNIQDNINSILNNINSNIQDNINSKLNNINSNIQDNINSNLNNINTNINANINANINTNINENINENINKNIENKILSSLSNIDIDSKINTKENIYEKIKNKMEQLSFPSKKINTFDKKNLIFGIKKTILTDFNYLNNSSNNNDFRIKINKSYDINNPIFDCFYLFPNINEINTKNETNLISEKKVEIFRNIFNENDFQYFPIDFIACGITIPLKSNEGSYSKIIIKNLFWNIFQSINSNKYIDNELLCIVPEKNIFEYKKIKLQINFELHSQVSPNIYNKFYTSILPYKNKKIININPSKSCLYKVQSFKIETLNGSTFNNFEINLLKELNIECALLCVKISVPNDCIDILKGYDKYNNILYGNIPFSQFILNFDYEIF
jgi:hypothetical protein